MSESPSHHKHTNRLARESSPYLLQHAHNPVDWYPWGPEAIEASRAQNKPIFLSVGYSTCYWCHVMERQCFEVESIAAVMNELFINIKVDREERPDVDQLYMTAVQAMTQHGGWPMSVFLTPDLKPFYGGTYFPPTDANGRPGFPTLLRALADAYHNRRAEVDESADHLVEILKQVAEPGGSRRTITIDQAFVNRLIERSTRDYEPMHGGFGGAPKFPRETLLELLLARSAKPQSGTPSELLNMTRHALNAMANGGIRDHLGGGFHRYSTDAKWLVPHFEIMLYDNAMLGWCYTEVFRQTGDARYARVARGVFDFVLREMTSPSGAFFTAFDAEVDAQEGLSYLWTPAEIEQLLGTEDAKVFNRVHGVDRGPNFADPHHGSGTPDKSILFLPDGPGEEENPQIAAMRGKLYEARRMRKQPLLDTKVLTSWNALMIRAMAYASRVLNEARYLQAAIAAADFLLSQHRKPDGGLFRTSRLDADPPSNAKLDGFLDDYAFFCHALLALHEVSNQSQWREAAKEIATEMCERFCDANRGGFYFTDRSATDLIVRQKVATDSPLPSGNAIAASAMLKVGNIEVARKTISLFAHQLESHGEGMSAMALVAMEYVEAHGALTVEPTSQKGDRPLSPRELAMSVVTLEAEWIDAKQLALVLSIQGGYHINVNRAVPNLISTELLAADASSVESIEYPAGEEKRSAFSDSSIRVYDGDTRIVVRFREPVRKPVEMSLRYQACNQSACLEPVTKRFEVPAP